MGFDIGERNPALLTVASSLCRHSQAWFVTDVTRSDGPSGCALSWCYDGEGVGLVAETQALDFTEVVAVDLVRERPVADDGDLGQIGPVVDRPVAAEVA